MLKFVKGKSFNFVFERHLRSDFNSEFVENQVGSRNFYAVIEYLHEQ